jgi:hypothetical protein
MADSKAKVKSDSKTKSGSKYSNDTLIGKLSQGKIGTYQEAPGGGTPLPKNHKAPSKEWVAEHRKSQPRDEDGQFTYNSANAKPLKFGPSRGTTIPPFLKGVKLKAFMKGTEDGKGDTLWDAEHKRFTFHKGFTAKDLIYWAKHYINSKEGFGEILSQIVEEKTGKYGRGENLVSENTIGFSGRKALTAGGKVKFKTEDDERDAFGRTLMGEDKRGRERIESNLTSNDDSKEKAIATSRIGDIPDYLKRLKALDDSDRISLSEQKSIWRKQPDGINTHELGTQRFDKAEGLVGKVLDEDYIDKKGKATADLMARQRSGELKVHPEDDIKHTIIPIKDVDDNKEPKDVDDGFNDNTSSDNTSSNNTPKEEKPVDTGKRARDIERFKKTITTDKATGEKVQGVQKILDEFFKTSGKYHLTDEDYGYIMDNMGKKPGKLAKEIARKFRDEHILNKPAVEPTPKVEANVKGGETPTSQETPKEETSKEETPSVEPPKSDISKKLDIKKGAKKPDKVFSYIDKKNGKTYDKRQPISNPKAYVIAFEKEIGEVWNKGKEWLKESKLPTFFSKDWDEQTIKDLDIRDIKDPQQQKEMAAYEVLLEARAKGQELSDKVRKECETIVRQALRAKKGFEGAKPGSVPYRTFPITDEDVNKFFEENKGILTPALPIIERLKDKDLRKRQIVKAISRGQLSNKEQLMEALTKIQ